VWCLFKIAHFGGTEPEFLSEPIKRVINHTIVYTNFKEELLVQMQNIKLEQLVAKNLWLLP